MTKVIPQWKEQLIESYEGDEEIHKLIAESAVDLQGPKEYYLRQGVLKFRNKWVVGSIGGLRRQVFEELHNNSVGGHFGQRATIKRILEYFYWPTIRQEVGRWIREFPICQQVKGRTSRVQDCYNH